jgi:hypothetical protein
MATCACTGEKGSSGGRRIPRKLFASPFISTTSTLWMAAILQATLGWVGVLACTTGRFRSARSLGRFGP